MLCDFRRVIFPDPVTLNRFEAVLFVFSFDFFDIFLLRSRMRPRHEHHDHQAAIQRWCPLDRRDVGQEFGHMIELISPEHRVRDLPGPELAGHLDLIPFFQELPSFSSLEAEIMLRDPRAYLYTLYVLLFFLPFPLPLLHFVLVLAMIDDPADRRLGGRRDHHQVEALLLGNVQGLAGLEYAKLGSVGANDAYVAESKTALVNQWTRFGARVSPKSSYLSSPSDRSAGAQIGLRIISRFVFISK